MSPAERALALLEPVLAALSEAHAAGLVHRDVKPENVLIADDGRIKVADFGLARAFDASVSQTATRGVLIGTVSYLAPELIVDGSADPRVDVYAAGVLLFEMLTGRKPHEGEGAIQIAFKHVNEDIAAPSTCTSQPLPAYVDALVTRATSRERERRQADAKVFLQQARRVAATLRAGVVEDEELTADLLPAGPGLGRVGVRTASTTSTRTPTARAPAPEPPRAAAAASAPARGPTRTSGRRGRPRRPRRAGRSGRTTTSRCPTARRPPPSSASAVSPEPVWPGRPWPRAPLRSTVRRHPAVRPGRRSPRPGGGPRRPGAWPVARGAVPSSHAGAAPPPHVRTGGVATRATAYPARPAHRRPASPPRPAAAAVRSAPPAPWARAAARGRAADGGRGLRRLVVGDRALHLDTGRHQPRRLRRRVQGGRGRPRPRRLRAGVLRDGAGRLDHRDRARRQAHASSRAGPSRSWSPRAASGTPYRLWRASRSRTSRRS